jgi:UDP-N-acetylmuramate: L-alanyl-gamma-D-glutamyl-meso-diaminopimelate ligase
VHWECIGDHNVNNGLMAIAAARHAGVVIEHAIAGLSAFRSPKRRMELKGEVAGIRVYDDFAHHPTAIATTLGGLRAKVGGERILAVLEPRSNTMKLGVHKEELAGCFNGADEVFFFQPPNIGWDLGEVTAHMEKPGKVFNELDTLINRLVAESRDGDHILIMSNGGFGGIHDKLLARLREYHGML